MGTIGTDDQRHRRASLSAEMLRQIVQQAVGQLTAGTPRGIASCATLPATKHARTNRRGLGPRALAPDALDERGMSGRGRCDAVRQRGVASTVRALDLIAIGSAVGAAQIDRQLRCVRRLHHRVDAENLVGRAVDLDAVTYSRVFGQSPEDQLGIGAAHSEGAANGHRHSFRQSSVRAAAVDVSDVSACLGAECQRAHLTPHVSSGLRR